MTRAEVLEQVVRKAVNNGWAHPGMEMALQYANERDWERWSEPIYYLELIFTEGFLTSFFGIETMGTQSDKRKILVRDYHHTQLLKINDHLKYLERFL